MAFPVLSDITGSVQKYFEDSWMDRPQEDFRTPLANSNLLEKAVIPKNSGQYAEFRKFSHFTPETESGNDSPKTYAESSTEANNEPTTGVSLTASIFRVGLEVICHWSQLANLVTDTDPTDLVAKTKDEFFIMVRRILHRLTNDRAVRTVNYNALSSTLGTIMTSAAMPQAFKTIYAGGANSFGDLTEDSVITMADLKRARSLLRNRRVPGMKGMGTNYACILSEASKDQLLEDPTFRDIVKRHEDWAQKTAGIGDLLASWEGLDFYLQDDDYRANLPAAGGALTTREDDGKVLVAHILGKGAMGYVDFGSGGSVARRTLRPSFKVQDISKTGTGITVGWRMYYQACVTDRVRGLNLAHTSRFTEDIDDIAE
jgi:N4-gp56 family major capsid protein